MLNKTRVITAVWMALILIPFLFLGGYFFYGLGALIAYIATYELIKMHNEKHNLPSFLTYLLPCLSSCFVIVVMVSKMMLSVQGFNYILFSLLVIMVVLMILPLFYKEVKMTDGFFYIGAVIYGGVSFAIIASLRNINIYSLHNLVIFNSIDVNLSALCVFGYVLVTTMFTDIGAYEIGCRFGKHKLIPDVSPKKSVEGAIGGSIIGAIMGTSELVLVEHFVGFNLFGIDNMIVKVLVVFGLSLILTIISQIGDLIASKLKREYGIKDYGNIFPGHGGIMDRFDSLILTSAVFYILLALFGVVLC